MWSRLGRCEQPLVPLLRRRSRRPEPVLRLLATTLNAPPRYSERPPNYRFTDSATRPVLEAVAPRTSGLYCPPLGK